eukprot:scaffold10756_cov60-Phaeocystis_antarctica.AAC.1
MATGLTAPSRPTSWARPSCSTSRRAAPRRRGEARRRRGAGGKAERRGEVRRRWGEARRAGGWGGTWERPRLGPGSANAGVYVQTRINGTELKIPYPFSALSSPGPARSGREVERAVDVWSRAACLASDWTLDQRTSSTI